MSQPQAPGADSSTGLERQLAQLQAVYAAMHDGLVVFDGGGNVVVANDAAAHLTGYTSTSEMMRDLRSFSTIFELFELDGRLLPFEQWPVNRAMRGEQVSSIELAMRRKDIGREWVARFSAQPVRDADGGLNLVVLITSDVTDRVRREQALRASEERFRALADSMPQLVWTARADGSVDYYNARAREYAGLEPRADGSWSWHPIVHPDDLVETLEAWKRALASGSSYQCEHRVRMADGSFRWHVSRARAVQAATGERWFGTATDIHERKLAEENVRRAMATRDQVVSVVAHDLRNPLGVLNLSLPVLRRVLASVGGSARQQAEGCLIRIERQVTRIEKLIDEFLDAATLQAGQPLALERRPTDLVALAHELITERSQEVTAHAIELRAAVPSLVGEWDPDRLERVVGNLLSNAIKYNLANHPVVVELDAEPQHAVVRVIDRGIGIAEQDQPRIFEWYVRGENARQHTAGIGLGLAGARRIVEQHGGTLTVQSQLQAGSTFTIRLPFSPAAAEPSA